VKAKNFFAELQRRNVYRVAVAYGVVSWLLVQIATQVFPFFEIPNWATRLVVIVLLLGFPIALIFAWVYELTPEGIKRTEEVEPHKSIRPATGRKLDFVIIGVLLVVIGVFALNAFRQAKRAELPNIPEKSIAVLPFENRSEEKANAYLADGIHDEILTSLAKVADLKVISRTSVMQYKTGTERNLREIAKALGVAHVLEGTVQRADGRVRVSAQLIDARSDSHLWAERYDRDLADVFAIESEVAEKIVAQLKSKLSPEEKAAINEQPTTDLTAFDLYTRAKKLIEGSVISVPVQDSVFEAIRLLDAATERDPRFALAYYQLAHAHDLIYFVGADHTPARLAMAEAAIRSLSQLRPTSGEAHLSRARHLYWVYHDYDRAREELRLARKSLPNEPIAFRLAGYIDRRQSRWDESINNLNRAIELDPQNPYDQEQVARTYQCLRRYAEAERAFDRAVALAPKDANMRASRAEIEFHWHADPQPLSSTIESILREDPGAAKNVATLWLQISEYQRDANGAQHALAALPVDACYDETIPFPVSWCDGLVAEMRGDQRAAHDAFMKAREETASLLHDQPDYAEALCVLGMADAFLGHKEAAIREGRRAVELLPVAKDSIIGSLLVQYLAIIYARLGEKNDAFQQLVIAARTPGFLSYGKLRLDPYWDPLRREPRFEQIVASLAP
jgi:TolB-like protein/Flp pilus assembly protein TadD